MKCNDFFMVWIKDYLEWLPGWTCTDLYLILEEDSVDCVIHFSILMKIYCLKKKKTLQGTK